MVGRKLDMAPGRTGRGKVEVRHIPSDATASPREEVSAQTQNAISSKRTVPMQELIPGRPAPSQ